MYPFFNAELADFRGKLSSLREILVFGARHE